jgi:hypothetical protein
MTTNEVPQSTDRPSGTGAGMGPGAGFVPSAGLILLAVGTVLASVVTLYSLWAFWPSTVGAGAAAGAPAGEAITYFGWHTTISREFVFFLVVAIAGALGGAIHTLRSVAWYVGNRELRWSWLPFNVLLPVIGALGGTVFYLIFRAGLFSPSTSVSEASPFGFAAVAVLVGLFSEQAMEKLRDVATNVFSERPTGEDHVQPKAPSAEGQGPAAGRTT